jgi:hypothetical protein
MEFIGMEGHAWCIPHRRGTQQICAERIATDDETLEFVGNAVFIPYFLIGVGMLVNVKHYIQRLQHYYRLAV